MISTLVPMPSSTQRRSWSAWILSSRRIRRLPILQEHWRAQLGLRSNTCRTGAGFWIAPTAPGIRPWSCSANPRPAIGSAYLPTWKHDWPGETLPYFATGRAASDRHDCSAAVRKDAQTKANAVRLDSRPTLFQACARPARSAQPPSHNPWLWRRSPHFRFRRACRQ